MTPTRETYLTARQVADWLNLGEATIRTAAAAKRLPATRVNGVWRFLESELAAFLDLHHTRAAQRLTVVPRHSRIDREAMKRGTGRRNEKAVV